MLDRTRKFIHAEAGAVTVDWTVLSAAAVGLAIATTALMSDSIAALSGRMDEELRSRQLSDDFVSFLSAHFEPLLATGDIEELDAEAAFTVADQMMNNEILTALTEGIDAIIAGTIQADDIPALVAVASVAYQRNLVDTAVLNEYFGFDGSTPPYAEYL